MRKTILDIPIDWIAIDELKRKLELFVVSRKPHQITTVNPEFIVLSHDNKEYQKVLRGSDLSLADGTGIIIAQAYFDRARAKSGLMRLMTYLTLGLQFLFLPHSFSYRRITGVYLGELLMAMSAEQTWRVFLLGAAKGVAAEAAEIWRQRYPGLIIAGTSAANPQDKETITAVKAAKPDILLVAYGPPKQDTFIAVHRNDISVPIMVGVGGIFDTLTGRKYNPPGWIKALGLEWLAYLIVHPRRLKRIWRATVGFSLLVLKG